MPLFNPLGDWELILKNLLHCRVVTKMFLILNCWSLGGIDGIRVLPPLHSVSYLLFHMHPLSEGCRCAFLGTQQHLNWYCWCSHILALNWISYLVERHWSGDWTGHQLVLRHSWHGPLSRLYPTSP